MINVKDYGAKGDGVTDDTASINAAIAATGIGGTCYFPTGVYMVNKTGLQTLSGVTLLGDPHQSVLRTLTPFDHPYDGLVRAPWGSINMALRYLSFDMQSWQGSAVYFRDCTYWAAEDCQFENLLNWGLDITGGSNFRVEGCSFSDVTNGNAQATGKAGIILTRDDSGSCRNYRIINNQFTGTDISAGGTDGIISGNFVTGVTAGSGIFTTTDSERLIIENNSCASGRGRDINRTAILGYELWGKNLIIRGNIATDNDGGGLSWGAKNSVVTDNLCYDNGRTTNYAGLNARYIDDTNNAGGSLVVGNRCFDSLGANGTQGYGFAYQVSSLVPTVIMGKNHFAGNKFGDTKIP